MGIYCLRPCETCLLEPVGPDMGAPCRIAQYPCPNVCTNVCPNVCTNTCQCGIPQCECCRDIATPCKVCPPKPSPVCSCLGACGCDCELTKAALYFPEVEYPVTVLDVKPSYYGTCWTC
ncbi:unnamed protein product, partial [Iphiclides podalirius]